MKPSFSLFLILLFFQNASGQTIKSFIISNSISGAWYGIEKKELIIQEDSTGSHYINDYTLVIDKPNNKCRILAYPTPKSTSIPLDIKVLEAVKFYDSLTRASTFEIVVTPERAKTLNTKFINEYHQDIDYSSYPFRIDEDTAVILSLSQIADSSEMGYICDGTYYSFNCMIVYEGNDTVWHGLYGKDDLSNSMYLNKTLPIFCLFQKYPDLFVELNSFNPINENNIDEIIFRFIRWQKQIEKEQKMDGILRKNIQIGSEVEIVQKHHQRTGELTDGFVEKILTKSPTHPHGIKVKLETGEVGRVKVVIDDPLEDYE